MFSKSRIAASWFSGQAALFLLALPLLVLASCAGDAPPQEPEREIPASREDFVAIDLERDFDLVLDDQILAHPMALQFKTQVISTLLGGQFEVVGSGDGAEVRTQSSSRLSGLRFASASQSLAGAPGFSSQNVSFVEVVELPTVVASEEPFMVNMAVTWNETDPAQIYTYALAEALRNSGLSRGWFALRETAIVDAGIRVQFLVWQD